MTGGVAAYNQTQKNPESSVSGTSTTVGLGDPVIYTTPAGKKTKVTSVKITYVALGTNTFMEVKIKLLVANHVTVIDAPQQLSERLPGGSPLTLAAGETILFHGDNAGNNGTMNYFITFVELPA